MTCTVQHGTCWSACLDAAASEVRKALYDKAMQRVDQRAAITAALKHDLVAGQRWKAGGVVDDFERFSYQASREGRYRQVGLHCRLLACTVLAHVGNTIGHAGAIKGGQGCFSPYAAGAGQR